MILLNDGVRAADPKFIDLNSVSDELENLNDDDDNEAVVDND